MTLKMGLWQTCLLTINAALFVAWCKKMQIGRHHFAVASLALKVSYVLFGKTECDANI